MQRVTKPKCVFLVLELIFLMQMSTKSKVRLYAPLFVCQVRIATKLKVKSEAKECTPVFYYKAHWEI